MCTPASVTTPKSPQVKDSESHNHRRQEQSGVKRSMWRHPRTSRQPQAIRKEAPLRHRETMARRCRASPAPRELGLGRRIAPSSKGGTPRWCRARKREEPHFDARKHNARPVLVRMTTLNTLVRALQAPQKVRRKLSTCARANGNPPVQCLLMEPTGDSMKHACGPAAMRGPGRAASADPDYDCRRGAPHGWSRATCSRPSALEPGGTERCLTPPVPSGRCCHDDRACMDARSDLGWVPVSVHRPGRPFWSVGPI